MIVEEVMSPSPYVAQVTDSVGKAMRMLSEADIRHLPVVGEGELLGIVSDRDLRGVTPALLTEVEPAEIQRLLAQPIVSLMSSDVVSVNPETELAEAIDLMLENKIGALPVVEADSARVVGIVSYVDILRALRNQA
jgi:CBS-domain-containing membrane protein